MKRNRRLPGGSVLNSSLLSIEDSEQVSAFNATYKNFGLKAGIIVRSLEKDDEDNLSKLGPEYDVLVIEQDGSRSISAIQYKNCMTMDTFGSIADFFEFRYRSQTKEGGDDGRNPEKQDGSIVLMLCLDGSAEKGIIVGALKHPSRSEELTKDMENHLHGEFNGLNIQVDKDGAFKIEFKGPRSNDGTYTNEEAAGSYFEIDKDGNTEISTNNEEFIKLDKQNKNVSIGAGANIQVSASEEITVESGSTLTHKIGSDFISTIEGKANFNAKSSFDITTNGAFNLKGASGSMNFDANLKITSLQIALDGLVSVGGIAGTPAITLSTQFIGTGNLGLPVISQAMGPFSSRVLISP